MPLTNAVGSFSFQTRSSRKAFYTLMSARIVEDNFITTMEKKILCMYQISHSKLRALIIVVE
jgi:hypothetical protein